MYPESLFFSCYQIYTTVYLLAVKDALEECTLLGCPIHTVVLVHALLRCETHGKVCESQTCPIVIKGATGTLK